MSKEIIKNKKNEKGVSLILSFFVMLIILTVVVLISMLLYGEIKILRNVGNSIVAFYAADSGVEKVLYYDRQVLPMREVESCNLGKCGSGQICVENKCLELYSAKRGLCTLTGAYPNSASTQWFLKGGNYCTADSGESGNEKSIFCNSGTRIPNWGSYATGCVPNICDNCKVSFKSMLNKNLYFESSLLNKDVSYETTATITTNTSYINGQSIKTETFEVNSKGTYLEESRKIYIKITTTE